MNKIRKQKYQRLNESSDQKPYYDNEQHAIIIPKTPEWIEYWKEDEDE